MGRTRRGRDGMGEIPTYVCPVTEPLCKELPQGSRKKNLVGQGSRGLKKVENDCSEYSPTRESHMSQSLSPATPLGHAA